jgi:hypothetical protein
VEAIDAWQRAWELGTDSDRVVLRSRIEETGDQLTTAERDQLSDTVTQPEVRTILALGMPNELGAPPMAPPPVATHAEQAAAEQESEADTEAGYARSRPSRCRSRTKPPATRSPPDREWPPCCR